MTKREMIIALEKLDVPDDAVIVTKFSHITQKLVRRDGQCTVEHVAAYEPTINVVRGHDCTYPNEGEITYKTPFVVIT